MADVVIPSAQIAVISASGQNTADARGPQPSLQQGSTLSGTIIGRDASGNFQLRTAQGTLSLQSTTPLTYNSDVTIRIGANTAGSTSARIVSVNGEPFAEFSAPQPEESDTVSPTLLTQAPQATSDNAATTQAGVKAVVVSAPTPSPSSSTAAVPQTSANAQLEPGSTVVIRVASDGSATEAQSPQTPAAPAPSSNASAAITAQPQQVAESSQPATLQQPTQPQVPQQPAATTANIAIGVSTAAPVETELNSGQTVNQASQAQAPQDKPAQASTAPEQAPQAAEAPQAQATTNPSASTSALYSAYTKQSAATPAPVATTPPGAATAPSSTPASASTSIPALIVSADEDGNIALATTLGTLNVKAADVPALSAFTPGTAVTIEALVTEAAQAIADDAPATVIELASSWQSLKDIVNLENTNTPTATNTLLSRLPQLGPSFLSESTNFMTALIGGDARKLLGDDTIDTLRQNGRDDLIDKFSAEVTGLNDAFAAPTERQSVGWQTLFLPFVFQEALQQARIYVKRDAPKKDRVSKATHDTRFVVEVDLSELGPMQMDGLVRKKQSATAFDLVIRSHTAFSPDAQNEIVAIYTNAAQLTGFKGSITFQVTRDFPVKPMEEIIGSDIRSITV